jgi:hypothetical protein
LIFAGISLLVGAGCDTLEQKAVELAHPPAPPWQPGNVHRPAAALPVDFRRVAVLPLAAANSQDLQAGKEALGSLPGQALGQRGLFEVLPISAQQLQQWTGRDSLAADEPLPRDLLVRLRAETGCDGVLFVRLTRFQPYPPASVGWSFRLVAAPGAEILWAVDEVADTRLPSVASGLQLYFRQRGITDLEARHLAASPRRVAEYSLEALFQTLPPR